jgi:hypothetical protein
MEICKPNLAMAHITPGSIKPWSLWLKRVQFFSRLSLIICHSLITGGYRTSRFFTRVFTVTICHYLITGGVPYFPIFHQGFHRHYISHYLITGGTVLLPENKPWITRVFTSPCTACKASPSPSAPLESETWCTRIHQTNMGTFSNKNAPF